MTFTLRPYAERIGLEANTIGRVFILRTRIYICGGAMPSLVILTCYAAPDVSTWRCARVVWGAHAAAGSTASLTVQEMLCARVWSQPLFY